MILCRQVQNQFKTEQNLLNERLRDFQVQLGNELLTIISSAVSISAHSQRLSYIAYGHLGSAFCSLSEV